MEKLRALDVPVCGRAQGHSREYYEAASIDGANAWQRFWSITLPALRPVTAVVVTLASINTLKLFDLVYVMTAGGPNHSSEVLTTWMYQQGFKFNNMGYGSAIAVVLLIVTFVLTAIQFTVLSRETGLIARYVRRLGETGWSSWSIVIVCEHNGQHPHLRHLCRGVYPRRLPPGVDVLHVIQAAMGDLRRPVRVAHQPQPGELPQGLDGGGLQPLLLQ